VKEMMIDATIVENQDISNRTALNEEGEKIREMKIQNVSELGSKEKHPKMIMMKLTTCVSWH